MKEQGHLQIFDLTLTTRSPLFVGSGRRYTGLDYFYDSNERILSFVDTDALSRFIWEKGLIDSFEQYFLSGKKSLKGFLTQECGLSQDELTHFIRCTIGTENVQVSTKKLWQVFGFCRNAAGQIYVPGSSVKGALRTALQSCIHLQRSSFGQTLTDHGNLSDRSALSKIPPIEKLFRGMSVSDSLPIPDSRLTLTGKRDIFLDGSVHSVAIYRESVIPDTRISLRLTLDQSILKGRVTRETLMEYICRYDSFYQSTFPIPAPPDRAADIDYENCLIVGGGAGFFSKTTIYSRLGKQDGVVTSSKVLSRRFNLHGHQADVGLGLAPRMMKCTEYGGKLFPYGVCEVNLS